MEAAGWSNKPCHLQPGCFVEDLAIGRNRGLVESERVNTSEVA